MTGDWALPNLPDMIIDSYYVYSYINFKKYKPEYLPISDIAYKDISNIDVEDSRYLTADTSFPGIVVKDMPNPYNKPYRLIDGRHRILKRLNDDQETVNVYILTEQDIRKFYTDYGKYEI